MDFSILLKPINNCTCGQKHLCAIKDIVAKSGAINEVGEILDKNNFGKNLLVVADKTTFNVANGIQESLTKSGFNLTFKVYDFLRVATMQDVFDIENILTDNKLKIDGVLAIGTGSIHDTCRLATARQNVLLCLFATAPSMDGFASYSAPIVNGNFKITYPAKCPEVIIADTKILAQAPLELKCAGFGDMLSKYVALIDWQVSNLITGEPYCEKVASLTRLATDKMMELKHKITKKDEETTLAIFEALIMTGIAMSWTKTSRPASGTEHILAHYWECKELLQGKTPNYHGEDVGVATLLILKKYNEFAIHKKISAHAEKVDWQDIYSTYGELAQDVKKINTPDTITDGINPFVIEKNWDKIVEIINSVPTYEECLNAMKIAGCKTTIDKIGKDKNFVAESLIYHPFMRKRLSLLRLKNMFEFLD